MDCTQIEHQIVSWLKSQIANSGQKGFVVGVSGGVDSAVVAALCARTGFTTLLVSLPMSADTKKADRLSQTLNAEFENVFAVEANLEDVMNQFKACLSPASGQPVDGLVEANLASRLRMCALYSFSNSCGLLVAGTGNKVEDFGIGFCTKGGDAQVDISPIGDLLKSEVRALAHHLGIPKDIADAVPTDGLWADGRTDEDQIGASYDELEWAMSVYGAEIQDLTERQEKVLDIYTKRHEANAHKMRMPPVCVVERRSKVATTMKNFTFEFDTTASLDIDCQRSFTPLCPNELPVPDGDAIVDALNNQAKYGKFRVGSKDWHPANALWIANEQRPLFTSIVGSPNMDVYWNAHCMAGTEGAELLDGLPEPEEYDFMVYKGLEKDMHPYGACYHDLKETRSTGLIEFLKANGVKTVIVGGLATDFCVKATVFQLAPHFKVLVNLDACRAIGDDDAVKKVIEAFLAHPKVDVAKKLMSVRGVD
jgi:NAD+ synthase